MNKSKKISRVISRELMDTASSVEGRSVAVALSGGVDSCSVLAALRRVDIKPTVISYTPDTHESTDFNMARETASNLSLEFVGVRVAMSDQSLENMARKVTSMGYHSKVEVESLSPMLWIARAAASKGADVLMTGDQADGFFCLSKWAAHNYDRSRGVPFRQRSRHVKDDTDPSRIDGIRARYYEEDLACTGAVASICESFGVEAIFPYRSEAIFRSFNGSLWSEINRPRIKEPIRLAFDDWFCEGKILVRNTQVNLHKGDSNFGDTMSSRLMSVPHLRGPWKTPKGLYGAMYRGDI